MQEPVPSEPIDAFCVLVLPATEADGAAIDKLLRSCEISCRVLPDVPALCAALAGAAGVVVISEEILFEDSALLVQCLLAQEVWSDIPVIVLSRSGVESAALADIMPHLGNVSVIERPVRMSTLVTLIRSCLRARTRQYQVRTHLAEQEAARIETERASRMKDEFLATLSHELRTPLNAVLGWSQVLGQLPSASGQLGEGLRVIERNARAQAQIIEDLLDMSSIISGKVRLEAQRVELAPVIEAAINAVRPAADAKGVDLEIHVGSNAGAVSGDPNRLQQVFWNLVTNAVKFTPQNGRVAVTLERVNSHLKVSVVDNGDGIDPAFLPHVFERFRQADASTTRRHGGLGLGLSIVKQLVDLHGGSIRATSAGKGKGSNFTVELPLLAADAYPAESATSREQLPPAATDDPATQLPPTNLEGVRVLVVDDEPDARALVERLLKDCEATVMTASSVSEALEKVAHERPDVLVSDIGMPKEDGYALIRRIRKLEGDIGDIPAIAFTAYARVDDRVKAIQAGYQSHLPKPVDPLQLVSTVARLVKRPNIERH